MAFTSTAAVLDAIEARVEALTPSTQVNADDRFQVIIGEPRGQTVPPRTCFLSAFAGIPNRQGMACYPWTTQVALEVVYLDVPTEAGQPTIAQTAIRDSEDILADLFTWASQTDGIDRIDPDTAEVTPMGDGSLSCTRRIRVDFQRA